jgi:hypothetical protein
MSSKDFSFITSANKITWRRLEPDLFADHYSGCYISPHCFLNLDDIEKA